jgi:HK97 family phage major capsid protein
MPSLKELKDKHSQATKEINDILVAATNDNDRDLTDDEREAIESRDTLIAQLDEQIAAENRSFKERIAAANNDRIKQAGQRRSKADSFTSAGSVGNPKDAFLEDPKKGFRDHREFLCSVMEAGRNYGVTDDRRLKYLATAGSDEQSSISDPYGGFLVPQGFSPNVMNVMAEADPIASRVTQIPMENAVVPINARVDKDHTTSVSGGLVVGRREETQGATSSRMQFEQVILNAQSLFGLAFASEELLARSPVSFVALLEAGFRDEFPAKLINERLNGTGVGQFEGVVNSPCIVSVAKETGQAADTIVYENIIKMRARCWGYGNAIWLANHDTLPQLMLMNQAVGTGGVVVWQPSAREGEPELLLGRPIFFTEFTKTVGDTGDIVLGNWSQYLEGTLSPMQQAESMHVRFENHERTFKFWIENDGRCWWRSALTPKNSTATLSPFVKLDAR